MAKIIVGDSGPLIALARINQLTLLSKQAEQVVMPQAVARECLINPTRPGAQVIQSAINTKLITVQSIQSSDFYLGLLNILEEGEAQAIVLSQRLKAFLLIDEKLGRQIAKKNDIPIIGVGGILLAAKKNQLIKEVSPLLTALRQNGYYLAEGLIAEILTLAKEEI